MLLGYRVNICFWFLLKIQEFANLLDNALGVSYAGYATLTPPSQPAMSNKLFADRISHRPTSKYDPLKCTRAYLSPNRPVIIPAPTHFLSTLFAMFATTKKTAPRQQISIRFRISNPFLWDTCPFYPRDRRLLAPGEFKNKNVGTKFCVFAAGPSMVS